MSAHAPDTFATSLDQDAQALNKMSRLARTMANLSCAGVYCLELGPRQGEVSAGLAIAFKGNALRVIEPNLEKAVALKKRQPGLHIRTLPEWEALDAFRPKGYSSVVSGIQFKSLSEEAHRMTVQSILDYLAESSNGMFWHYGATSRPPFEAPRNYQWEQCTKLLLRLPPAYVWTLTYTRRASALSPLACDGPVAGS